MVENIDWAFIGILLLLALIFFGQAFINLAKKRFSPFGLDALMISITLGFSKKAQRDIIKKRLRDPKTIHKLGIDALLLGIGAILGLIYYFSSI